jgi:hypothetical protein
VLLDAFVACVVPKRMLLAMSKSPAAAATAGGSSALRLLPFGVLEAIRGSYFGDLADPKPWDEGRVMLLPSCMKRTYQVEEEAMEQQVQLLNQAALVSANSCVSDIEMAVSVPRAKEVAKWVPVEHLTVPSSCSELLDPR